MSTQVLYLSRIRKLYLNHTLDTAKSYPSSTGLAAFHNSNHIRSSFQAIPKPNPHHRNKLANSYTQFISTTKSATMAHTYTSIAVEDLSSIIFDEETGLLQSMADTYASASGCNCGTGYNSAIKISLSRLSNPIISSPDSQYIFRFRSSRAKANRHIFVSPVVYHAWITSSTFLTQLQLQPSSSTSPHTPRPPNQKPGPPHTPYQPSITQNTDLAPEAGPSATTPSASTPSPSAT